MKNQEVSRQLQKLKAQWGLVAEKCGGDVELEAQWAKYLCIRCAGFFEVALREILGDYLDQASSPSVARHGKLMLKRNQNPKGEQIAQILGSFDTKWREKLETHQCWTDGGKDSFDSVMNIRHTLAHGGDVGITLGSLTAYLENAVKVLNYVEKICRNEV